MKRKWAIARLVTLTGALSTATGAAAQELPPLEPILLNSSAVTCIKIAVDGSVSGAFIVVSSGLPERDRAVIAWVKQLRWDPAAPGDRFRNRWFPMPVAFGNAKTPEMPDHCAPDEMPRQTS